MVLAGEFPDNWTWDDNAADRADHATQEALVRAWRELSITY